MRRTGRFAVNILGQRHEAFAKSAALAADRFAGLDWEPGRGGDPLLSHALATLECEIVAEYPAGDHWIIVGQVEELNTNATGEPLLFYAGQFRSLRYPD